MLITTCDVLDNSNTLWQAIPAFAGARADLGTAITAVQQEELKQADTTTGGTLDKRACRAAMCAAAVIVGGAVAAYADKQGDHELFAKVDFSEADLRHQGEQDCATNCQAILDAATANITALTAAKSAAQADLDNLEAKIGEFNTALTRPRQIRTGISGATSQIPALITAADRIVERQIDRLMERFKAPNPDFYTAYQVARVIVNTGGGPATPPAPPAPPATPGK